DLYLTMDIGGTGVGGSPTYDGEMTPRLKLTAVPYAFRAGSLATYNGATTYTSTLSVLAPTGGDQNFQIPDQGAAGTYSLLTTNTANNSFIQLQATTPGTAQTGNFNISGTGIANLLQAANLDTASAGTLGIGNTNATTINIGTNAAAHTINIGTGAAAQTISIGSNTSTSSLALLVGTGGFSLNTTGNNTFTSDSTGRIIIRPTTNNTGIFRIQDSSGVDLLQVDSGTDLITIAAPIISSRYIQTSSYLNLTTGSTTNFVTPQGSSVPTKINIAYYDPGAAGQVLALGIPSTTANTNSRVISVFDARTSAHQPSIALLSPNESNIFGLSYDGSNTIGYLKNTGSGINFNVSGVDAASVSQSGTDSILRLGNTAANTGIIELANAATGSLVSLLAGATSAPYSIALPSAIGTAGQCLNIASIASTTENLGYSNCLTDTTGVQLQGSTPGTAQTGNFNITGTGIANLLQASNLDTAAAGTLGIGNTNATTINIGTNAVAHTVNIGTGAADQTVTIGSTYGGSVLNLQTGTGGFVLNQSGTNVVTIDSAGKMTVRPISDGIAFAVQDASGTDNILYVDSDTYTVHGFNLQAEYNTQTATFNVVGATTINYTTPLGTTISTKISVENFAPGSSVQSLALGITSGAHVNSSVISVFDARTAAHRPSIAVFSPDQAQTFGFSWEGSNTVATLKNSSSGINFQVSGVNAFTINQSGTESIARFGVASSNNGKIEIANAANSNIATLQAGVTAASYTSLLPTNLGSVGQCVAVLGVAGSTQTLGYSSCALATGGGYVTLQGATPGTPDSGNFNINGMGIVSNFKVNPGADSTTILQVSTNSGNNLLSVNSTNSYVINNGTKSLGNDIQNSSFESGGAITTTGEQGWNGPAQASIVNSSANANSGNYELQVTPNGTNLTTTTSQYMSVSVGDVIYAEGWVKNSAGANGTGGLYLEAFDKDKASVSTTTDAASLPGTTYVLRKVTYTVPSGVKYVKIGARVNSGATTGTYYFDDFYARSSVSAPAVFKNSVDSTTAFTIQSAAAAQTLFTADTSNNILKVGDSTGSDTNTTIFVLDSTSADPTTSLGTKNGGLFYRSDTGTLKAIIGGAVVDICTTATTCTGYAASATSSIQLQASSPGSQQTGNFNISGTGILSQLQTSNTSTPSSNSTTLVIRSGNATGTTSNSGGLTLDVGTATGTLGQITIGHTNVTTVMPGTLDVQGANALKLGTSSTSDGSILFRNSAGANTVTLKAAATNPASSITLTLPTALGSAGYCLKDTGSGALGFGDCGVGATVTMQNVYDNSSPASILLANAKDFTINAQDTGTDSNILMNLQCVTSCSTNGRFAVQNGGTDVFTVSPNSGGIVLGVATQIGSATTNGTQINLQLDSSSTYADSGTCTTTAFQGAMYYNTASQSIRTCQDGTWSDILTTRDLGLLMFGVVPDSGSSNQGDLPALVTSGVSGPCKVSWNSANSIHIEACIAYSGGRRVSVASTNITITGLTTTNIWTNVCLTGTNNQPALSTTATATETSSTSGFFPTFSISAPILCLAQVKGSTGTANNIAQIYDVRTFSTTQKLPMLASTAVSLGMLADVNPSTAVPSVNASRRMIGVVVATNGSTSTTSPNVILTTFGPAWVKATAGTAGDFVIQSATNGYTATNATIPNNSFNYEVGITPTSFSSTCSAASNCSGSLFVNFQVR
ncbi:MAG: hypothetical protein ABIO22_00610, partial [Candidatus Saccharimonadales bacterium]